jgi:TrpR-related protein YerC/YecD
MPRTQPKSISKEELHGFLDEFWTMVATLETKDEVKRFFRDLLSETEALMLARRVRIAKMLLQGISYEEIAETLHTGEGTIASVHRWLQSGFGGYTKSLPRLEQELKKNTKKRERQLQSYEPYSFEWLKRRYPLYFLLFNLFDPSSNKKVKEKRVK